MPASLLFASSPRNQRYALAILRIVTGIIFAAHGYQKLFTFGIAGIQGAFTQMGAPLPMITGPLIGVIEFFGGLSLVVGFLTRIVTLGLVADMLGAILLVHLANGFFAPKGVEFVLLLLVSALTLLIGGAGSPSIDDFIARRTANT